MLVFHYIFSMGVYDFLTGKCPYCDGEISIDNEGRSCGGIQTKICSVASTSRCFRTFKPGDRLPLLRRENYYEIVLPKSFWWVPKENTNCCEKPICVFVKEGIVGELRPLEGLPTTSTRLVYKECCL